MDKTENSKKNGEKDRFFVEERECKLLSLEEFNKLFKEKDMRVIKEMEESK